MSVQEELKTCPDRAEEVKAAARVCRFCGHRFEADGSLEQPPPGAPMPAAPTAPPPAPQHPAPPTGDIDETSNGNAVRRPVSPLLGYAIVACELLAVLAAVLVTSPAGVFVLAAIVLGIIRLVRRPDLAGALLMGSTVVVPIALLFLLFSVVFAGYRVPSGSMLPTLKIGERVVVNRLAGPTLGDIVVFHPPAGAEGTGDTCGDPSGRPGQACARPTPQRAGVRFIKRVVGLPGDQIAIVNGHVIRNGKREADSYIAPCAGGSACNLPEPITIPAGEYFMLGDNRGESDDSRYWGPVPKSWILGRVIWSSWPLRDVGRP
jgi:signal peptidase I